MRNTSAINAANPSALQLTTCGPTACAPTGEHEPGEPHFVFVTRDGRVMARQADGSVVDITPAQAAQRVC